MATSGSIAISENASWPKHVIKCFIDIMIEEVNKGNYSNGTFSRKVWKDILGKLNAMSGRSFNDKQIKQKYNRLRSQHRDFSLLLQHTGFGWNPETNTVTADERCWRDYILAHPEAVQFKKQGLEHYHLLGVIFNRSTATGVLHHSSTQDPPKSSDENQLEDEYLHGGVRVDMENDNDIDEDITEHVTRSGKRIAQQLDRKKKKENRSDQLSEALQAMVKASNARAEAHLAKIEMFKAKSTEASSVGPTSSDYSIAKCVAVLNELEDIEDAVYVKAMDKFIDPAWREMFMAVPSQRKRAWLNSLI